MHVMSKSFFFFLGLGGAQAQYCFIPKREDALEINRIISHCAWISWSLCVAVKARKREANQRSKHNIRISSAILSKKNGLNQLIHYR